MFNMARKVTGEVNETYISAEDRRVEDEKNSCLRYVDHSLRLLQQAKEGGLNSSAARERKTGGIDNVTTCTTTGSSTTKTRKLWFENIMYLIFQLYQRRNIIVSSKHIKFFCHIWTTI